MSKDWPLFSSPVGMQRSFQRVHSLHQFKKSIQQGLGNLSFSHLFFPFCSKLLILNSDCEVMARVARDSSELLSKNERFAGKNSYFCMFFTVFPLFMPKSKLLPSLFFQEQKSDSPGLGICSFDFEQIARILSKNERMSNLHKKMSE